VEGLERGVSPREIADAMGIKTGYVYNVRTELRRLGYVLVRPRQEEPATSPLPRPIETPRPAAEPTAASVDAINQNVDPEIRAIREDIALAIPRVAMLRERITLRQRRHQILAEETSLREQDDETRLLTAIVDICPDPSTQLLTDENNYVNVMRRLLNEEPYQSILQTWRIWGKDTEERLNACLRAFYKTVSFVFQNGLLDMSNTFLLDHVRQFFAYLANPTFGLCRTDFTPRLFFMEDWTMCAIGHIQSIQA
jgi:hypothetical protein